MTLDEMQECMETMGYTYEAVAKEIGFEENRVEAAFTNQVPPWDYNVLISLNRYFDAAETQMNIISESMAYRIEKQQGDYTIEDYYALPDDSRVELIDGVIYDMAAPTFFHQGIAGEIYRQIANYIRDKKGKCMPFMSPADVQLNQDDHTIVQPDVFIICEKGLLDRQRLHGAPDWIAEVLSTSTKSKDVFLKLNKYKEAGVREYWMIDPEDETVTVHDFENSRFPVNYTFDDAIPIGIYQGELKIDMREMQRYIEFLDGEIQAESVIALENVKRT